MNAPTTIGPYPIERELGRGGMGVVYLGRDTRLDRLVALKVLPDAFATDPERLARLEREARMLASLNHPNIAAIHGLEESDGSRFLALEYVDGETLAERISRGPLPLDEALDVCRQIATALEAAHESGVIHRDLKPGNVKITSGGEIKVLDFGLAKGETASSDSTPDLSQSPTLTYAATGAGVILGTAGYMSPEQARGKPVDRRTDIWSFGCVLYECLTGRQVFAGETVSDTIAKILERDPDLETLPAQTPSTVKRLLRRCLEKDPKRRLRDIGDARIDIEDAQGARTSAMRAVGAPAKRKASPLALVTTALIAAIAGMALGIALWTNVGPGAKKPESVRFSVFTPPNVTLAEPPNLAISPDGKTLAYVADDSTTGNLLWVRPIRSLEARALPQTQGSTIPFWSPDSRYVAFFSEGKLKKIRVSGGNPEIICEALNGRGGSWSSEGVIVFAPKSEGPLFKVAASGGTLSEVTTLDDSKNETGHRWPCFLPDGKRFIYVSLPGDAGSYESSVGSIDSPDRTAILSAESAPVFAAPGYLIFTRNASLMGQQFNAGSLALEGDPFPVGEPPGPTFMTGSNDASASTNGVLVSMGSAILESRVVWIDRQGKEVGEVKVPVGQWESVALSPDGKRVVAERRVDAASTDLWMADLVRGVASRFTFNASRNTSPIWSPDGQRVAFASNRKGPREFFWKSATGSGQDEVLHESGVMFKYTMDWTPDGKHIVFNQLDSETGWDIWVLPLEGDRESIPYLRGEFNEFVPQLSTDGKWMLYNSDESGTDEVYVQSFPEPGIKYQVSIEGAFFANWLETGEIIYMQLDGSTLMSVSVEHGDGLTLGAPKIVTKMPRGWDGFSPSADGKRFLTTVPAGDATTSITVAINWLEGIER